MLRSINWQLVYDVSEQLICSIFKGPAVQEVPEQRRHHFINPYSYQWSLYSVRLILNNPQFDYKSAEPWVLFFTVNKILVNNTRQRHKNSYVGFLRWNAVQLGASRVEERDAGELLMRRRESGHALTRTRGVLDEQWVLEHVKLWKCDRNFYFVFCYYFIFTVAELWAFEF